MNDQLIVIHCLNDDEMIPYKMGIDLDNPGTWDHPSDWIKELKVGTPVIPLEISSDELETVGDLIATAIGDNWKCPFCGAQIKKLASICDACHMVIEYEATEATIRGAVSESLKVKQVDSHMTKEVTNG